MNAYWTLMLYLLVLGLAAIGFVLFVLFRLHSLRS